MKSFFHLSALSLLLFLLSECNKETFEPVEEGATVKIMFNTPAYTRASAPDAETHNEGGVQTIDLWTFAHDKAGKIINFEHKATAKGNVIHMQSNFFEINIRGEIVSYTTLYAAANIGKINLNGAQIGGKYNNLKAYTADMIHQQSEYMTGTRIPIKATDEDMLKNIITNNQKVPAGSVNMDFPIMTDVQRVNGGIAALTMPLIHTYCRIGFTFIITGGSAIDELTIHSVSIDNLKADSYLFKEENLGSAPQTSVWNYIPGQQVFKAGNTYHTQPLSPTNMELTLCRSASHPYPFYFYSYQSLGEDESFDPTITLRITGNSATRTLTARLYDAKSSNGKKHHGLQRNHSYEVISTLNVSTLTLENLSINAHDWYDRGATDIPAFE